MPSFSATSRNHWPLHLLLKFMDTFRFDFFPLTQTQRTLIDVHTIFVSHFSQSLSSWNYLDTRPDPVLSTRNQKLTQKQHVRGAVTDELDEGFLHELAVFGVGGQHVDGAVHREHHAQFRHLTITLERYIQLLSIHRRVVPAVVTGRSYYAKLQSFIVGYRNKSFCIFVYFSIL